MISAISIKDRLKNRAAASGKTFQEVLTAYGLERTVYRLSVSEYMERFTLKGGIFLYALFDGEFARATRDIDLLAKNIPNNSEKRSRGASTSAFATTTCIGRQSFTRSTTDRR